MKYDLNRLSNPSQLEIFAEGSNKVSVSFVTPAHMEAIAEYAKKNKLTLSIRETGAFSLIRVAQGAKAKPHSILEKTIKPGSLKPCYPELSNLLSSTEFKPSEDVSEELSIEGIPVEHLVGFVGHWSELGSLLGLRLDHKDVLKDDSPKNRGLEALQEFISFDLQTKEPFIKLTDFNSFKEKVGSKWPHYLYTGDYDLGEIYKNNQPLMEGSPEKARVLKGINEAIARKQQADENNTNPIRKGSFTVKRASFTKSDGRTISSHLLQPEEGSEYAMIQHGDQMGYLTNQINEYLAKEREERKELKIKSRSTENKENVVSPKRKKAELVKSVAKEPDESLAWCVKGEWFLTNNRVEHKILRQAYKLKVSSAWSHQTEKRIGTNKSNIFKYKNKQ
jgi:hypothetical protein